MKGYHLKKLYETHLKKTLINITLNMFNKIQVHEVVIFNIIGKPKNNQKSAQATNIY